MTHLNVVEKYADPAVVGFWETLGPQGLQQAEQQMVARYFPSGGHVLDIGCGAGRAVLGLSNQGYTVTGIDLSLPMLKAGRRLSAEMRLGGANLLALPFADNAFTAAFIFFGALQHVSGRQNRRRALADMARVVEPGGRLILGLDNLAPTLACYAYWLKAKVFGGAGGGKASSPPTPKTADTTLWSRDVHPIVWHVKGVARTLRWRTWPGFVDGIRSVIPMSGGPEPGDTRVAQFSRPATPGYIYYHIYRVDELVNDAAGAGWSLLGFHAGSELTEGRIYPPAVRGQDKQLFFAFQKGGTDSY